MVGVLLFFLCGFPLAGAEDVVFSALGQSILLHGDRELNLDWIFVQCSFRRQQESKSSALANLYSNESVSIQPGRKHSRLQMFPNASLLLQDLQREDAGTYACQQYDRDLASDVLYQKKLVLLIAEFFPPSPVEEGTEVDLRCSLLCDENNDPCTVDLESTDLKWINYAGEGIRSQFGRYTIHSKSGSFSTNLLIKVTRQDHNRQWKCEFSVNGRIKISQEYTITIKGAGDAVYSALRQSVLLPCPRKPGPGSQRVQWKLEREPNKIFPLAVLFPNGSVTKLRPINHRMVMFPNASLHLPYLQEKDSGIYTCVSYNTDGSEVTLGEVSLMLLKVQAKPKSPVTEETEATLQCMVLCARNEGQCLSGREDVEVTWHNDKDQTLQVRKSKNGVWTNAHVIVKKSDHLRKWTCKFSIRNHTRASLQYLMRVKDIHYVELFVPEGGSVEFPGIDPSELESDSQLEWSFQRIGASEYQKLAVSSGSGSVHCAKCDPSPRLCLLPDTSLLLQDAQVTDAGRYKCSNSPEETIQIFNLAVLSGSNSLTVDNKDTMWKIYYIIVPVAAGVALLLFLVVTTLCLKKRRKGKITAVGERGHARNTGSQPDAVPMRNQDPQLEQVDSDCDDVQYVTITHQSNSQIQAEENAKESVIYAVLADQKED
uniref:Sialoadhesin-like isoform X2 n=1 Tax=Geotrypetes seraphini TaxID=260995 RepID=A0A6P8P710_GEOSA|nr:sialoadhesin-like isoform X2 [Geotrypetes seraphini]